MSRKFLPVVPGSDGAVMMHVGRYAREIVLTTFEMIGGVERMADWADKNPGDFYTKLLPKVIAKEVEHTGSVRGIEEMLEELPSEPIEAEFTESK